MMWTSGMGWSGWVLMVLTTVGFWALVVVGIAALFRGSPPRPEPRRSAGTTAGAILDERFARGEIDAEEYRRRREVLTTGH